MIIDIHTHIFAPNIVENPAEYFDDPVFSLLYSGGKSKIADHNAALKAMDESGVDYIAAMGFPWEREKYCEEQNRYLQYSMTSSGGRIIPFGSIPLGDIKHAEDWALNIRELGLAGIGEIAFYADGLNNNNASLLEQIFGAALRYSMPVCLHVNEHVGHYYTGKHQTDLNTIYTVLQNFKDLTVILAHWGGGLLFYELMKEVQAALANVYYDTAASPYLYKDDIYEIAIKITGSNKILFGSDFPLINFNRYLDSIEKNIKNNEDKKNILWGNASRILKRFIKDG